MRKSIKALGASSIPFTLWLVQEFLPFIVTQSLAFNVIRAAMCLPMAIMIMVEKEKPLYKLILIMSVLAPSVIHLIIGDKVAIISEIVITTVAIVILVQIFADAKKFHESNEDKPYEKIRGTSIIAFVFIPLLSMIRGIYYVKRYTYLDGWFPLWKTILIVSAVLGIALVVVLHKSSTIKKKFWGSIGWFFLGAMMSVAILFITVGNLNYALDRSNPEVLSVVINDKEIDHTRKGPDNYEFIFSIDGKQYSANVPSDMYYSYEIGDTFDIKTYRGAFNCPFFMAEFWE